MTVSTPKNPLKHRIFIDFYISNSWSYVNWRRYDYTDNLKATEIFKLCHKTDHAGQVFMVTQAEKFRSLQETPIILVTSRKQR